jgi:transposase-like protein
VANRTRKFPPEQRAAIAKDIKDTAGTPEGSYRKIAARHGCSLDTVQKVARENGLADRWQEGQQQTAAATSVKQSNAAERRSQLQLELLDDIAELRSRMFGDVTHLHVVKLAGPMAGEDVEQTSLPAGPRDWDSTMRTIGVAAARMLDLARFEAEQAGTAQSAGLLEQFMQSLRAKREQRDRERQEREQAGADETP